MIIDIKIKQQTISLIQRKRDCLLFLFKALGLLSIFFNLNPSYATTYQTSNDPLNSPQWSVMHKQFLQHETVVFDNKVIVLAPENAEDSMNVPVSFDATQLKNVKEIIVLADLNPLPLALRFNPKKIKPKLSFRIKLQQSSPVRIAVKTADGVWHVGGLWVYAAGGGCTLPSTGTASGNWVDTLGRVSAGLWQRSKSNNRLRVQVMHPMDTGLATGIPKFHIENLVIKDKNTKENLGTINLYEPISENPILSFDVGKHTALLLSGVDNNGNEISAQLN